MSVIEFIIEAFKATGGVVLHALSVGLLNIGKFAILAIAAVISIIIFVVLPIIVVIMIIRFVFGVKIE